MIRKLMMILTITMLLLAACGQKVQEKTAIQEKPVMPEPASSGNTGVNDVDALSNDLDNIQDVNATELTMNQDDLALIDNLNK